jgi:two-component system, OmpR family, sensor kinase
MRTPALRTRVRSLGTAVVLVLLVALDLVVYFSVRASMEAGLNDVLEARADIAEGLVSVVPDAAALAAELTERGIPAVVTGPDGIDHTAEPSVPRFSQGGVPTVTPFPRATLQRDLDEGMSVVVFATRAGLQATEQRLAITLGVATVVGLALSILLLDRAARTALSPLDEVVATAERTSGGQVTERLQPDRDDTELGRLAAAFDDMLDRLEVALDDAAGEQERTRRFLADAAHQLRTPIAGIQASVESLLRQDDPAERDRLMGSIVRETGRSARLVQALLRMAYLDQGRQPEAVDTDLAELVEEEVARTRDLAPRLLVAMDADTVPPRAAVDPQQVHEALANVMDNARRFANRKIAITVRRRGADIEILVRDDGPGIDEDAVDLVFERFATLDGRGGSGLGLPIARGIARAHGGDVTYEEGAFVLRFPAVEGRGGSDGPTAGKDARTPATSPSDTT